MGEVEVGTIDIFKNPIRLNNKNYADVGWIEVKEKHKCKGIATQVFKMVSEKYDGVAVHICEALPGTNHILFNKLEGYLVDDYIVCDN